MWFVSQVSAFYRVKREERNRRRKRLETPIQWYANGSSQNGGHNWGPFVVVPQPTNTNTKTRTVCLFKWPLFSIGSLFPSGKKKQHTLQERRLSVVGSSTLYIPRLVQSVKWKLNCNTMGIISPTFFVTFWTEIFFWNKNWIQLKTN